MISLSLLPYVVFVAVVISEIFLPQNLDSMSDLRRWFVNSVLYVLGGLSVRAFLLFLTAVGVSVFGSAASENSSSVVFVTVIFTIILFDFVGYLQHAIYHAIPALWKFHQIHHSDIRLDFSTAIRFHPVEVLITVSIDAILIVSFEIPSYAIAVHGVLITISGIIVHSNTRLFDPVDRLFRTVVVTPNMHRIHHSTNTEHYNKNFGVVLSFWDRLFNSYLALPRKDLLELEYGVSSQVEASDLTVRRLLLLPFKAKT